jgi:dTMP kinase
MAETGKLIALEGIDGAGTTTQCDALAEALTTTGIQVYVTAEPSKGPIGQLLRRALRREEPLDDMVLVPLFAADRLDHVTREIAPKLAAGVNVVTDRYVLSSLAYQSLIAPLEYVRAVNEHAKPADLTVFVKVSPPVAEKRRKARGGAVERFDAKSHQEQIAQRYEHALHLAAPNVTIDGDAGIEAVHEEILGHVLELLKK